MQMAEILKIETPADLGNDILVRQRLEGGVLRLVLNNPPANALSEAMLVALQETLDIAADDDETRVIILAANGHLFCAGHDVKEITPHRKDDDLGKAYFKALMVRCSTVMQSIVNNPKPVIAEVNGLATGTGCQLSPLRISPSSRKMRHFARPVCILACSARRPWSLCRAMWPASTRWKCC